MYYANQINMYRFEMILLGLMATVGLNTQGDQCTMPIRLDSTRFMTQCATIMSNIVSNKYEQNIFFIL